MRRKRRTRRARPADRQTVAGSRVAGASLQRHIGWSEPLEPRWLLAANLWFDGDPYLQDGRGQPFLGSEIVGEQVQLVVKFHTQDLLGEQPYTIRATLDGGDSVDDVRAWGTDLVGGPYNWVLYMPAPFVRSSGNHSLTVALDAMDIIDEGAAEDDNSRTIQFDAVDPAPPSGTFTFPLGDPPATQQAWYIGGYVDVDPNNGPFEDYALGQATYNSHDGLDIGIANFAAMDQGVPVLAVADGIVLLVHDGEIDRHSGAVSYYNGNRVLLYLGDDADGGRWLVDYGHLRSGSVAVQEGQLVTKGQQLGLVGQSGNAGGAHLHFGIRRNLTSTNIFADPDTSWWEGRIVESYLDAENYWDDPLPYRQPGDLAADVADIGVYDLNTPSTGWERPPDRSVFTPGEDVGVFFSYRGIPGTHLELVFQPPSGPEFVAPAAGWTIKADNVSETSVLIPRSGTRYVTLPAGQVTAVGQWTVGVRVDGAGPLIASTTFQRVADVAQGAPEIAVYAGDVVGANYLPSQRSDVIDFGRAAPTVVPSGRQFTIVNRGNAPLLVAPIENLPGFVVTQQPSLAIPPGGLTQFVLRLDTTVLGPRATTLNLTSNDASEGSYTLHLKGIVGLRQPDFPAPFLTNGLAYQLYPDIALTQLDDFGRSSLSGRADNFNLADVPHDEDNFAVRYSGYLDVSAPGNYTFFLRSDDGSRLWIGDQLVVDNDGLNDGSIERSGTIALDTGKHAIRVDYFERTVNQSLLVQYAGPGIAKGPIPDSRLFVHNNVWLDDLAPEVDLLEPADVVAPGGNQKLFVVTFSDNVAVDASDLDGHEIRIVRQNAFVNAGGPFTQLASLEYVDAQGDGPELVATYRIVPPGGTWTADDNDLYEVYLQSRQLTDVIGLQTPTQKLGEFNVAIVDDVPPHVVGITPENDAFISSGPSHIDVHFSEPMLQVPDNITGGLALSGSAIDSVHLAPSGPVWIDETTLRFPIEGTWTSGVVLVDLVPDDLGRLVRDLAGNTVVDTFAGFFIIDMYPPEVPEGLAITDDTGRSDTDFITSDNIPTVSWFEPYDPGGSLVHHYDVTIVGEGVSTLHFTLRDTSFNLGLVVPDGNYQTEIRAVDWAGNIGPAAVISGIIDTTPPTIPTNLRLVPDTGASSTDGITNNQLPTGHLDPANDSLSGVDGYWLGATETPEVDGIFFVGTSIPAGGTFPDGTYIAFLRAQDVAGNLGPVVSYTFTIDTAPPQVVGITPAAGSQLPVGPSEILVHFVEPMDRVASLAPQDFVLYGPGAGSMHAAASPIGPQWLDETTLRVPLEGTWGAGPVLLRFERNSSTGQYVRDLAGNEVADPFVGHFFVGAAMGFPIIGAHVFYNESQFDGNNSAANAADSNAIPDKTAYRAGQGLFPISAMTSYSKGINGIIVDLVDLPVEQLTAADFKFRMSGLSVDANNAADSWIDAPDPLEIVVLSDTPAPGVDRVVITWANNAIQNRFLQVNVNGNDARGGFNTNTGLPTTDTFYFGNKAGDTFTNSPSSIFITSASDQIEIRGHFAGGVDINNIWDIDHNKISGAAADQVATRGANFGVLRRIIIAAPSAPQAAPASGSSASPLASAALAGIRAAVGLERNTLLSEATTPLPTAPLLAVVPNAAPRQSPTTSDATTVAAAQAAGLTAHDRALADDDFDPADDSWDDLAAIALTESHGLAR